MNRKPRLILVKPGRPDLSRLDWQQAPGIAAGVLNWIDGNDQFIIGCRDNPAHLAIWQAWNRRMEEA